MPSPENKHAFGEQWRGRTGKVLAVGLTGIGIVGLLHGINTTGASLSSLYLLPICFVAWFLSTRAGMLAAVVSAAVWLAGELHGSYPHYHWPAAGWQCGTRLVFYIVVSVLVSRIRDYKLQLESMVRERTASLEAEVARRKEAERETAEVADREQERVAHELHDQLAAFLSGIAFRAKILAESLDRHAYAEGAGAQELVGLVNDATDHVRNLARLLAPVEVTQDDLKSALSRLGSQVERIFGVTCALEIAGELPTMSGFQVQQLCRIAQEAVRNAIQHGEAELVEVSVDLAQDHLKLIVGCDGKLWTLPEGGSTGLGFRIMRARTERLGGTLALEQRDNGTTAVICEVPMALTKPEAQPCRTGPESDKP